MSRVTFNRKRVKLKKLLGIRARLALLALILVAPLMLERARSLEEARRQQLATVSHELVNIAQHSANAQREVISSVETLLKSTAYVRASSGGIARSCDILRASLPANLPWIRSLSIVGQDGRVQCSTNIRLVSLDLSNRPAIQKARQTHDFVLSDFLISRADNRPVVMAAYPVSAINEDSQAIIVAGVNLDWMSKSMNDLGRRPGITAVLADSTGTIMAAPSDLDALIGHKLDTVPILSAIAYRAIGTGQDTGSLSFAAADGSIPEISFAHIPGTELSLIVSVDEAIVSAGINREIFSAYLQLGLVCLFVLLGAVFAAEKIIIKPIDALAATAKRFGQGDWAARAERDSMPAEFVPLARAFNAMAAQLGERERELVATNDRLTVMASIDMLSGLANRRGFQGRLEFEWMKAQQYDGEMSLLMIDVDHFKLFNDTYGHPEGDACLSRIGEKLAGIAAEVMGFGGRYGGEEFCLLLPNTNPVRALEIGEMVRTAVLELALPHSGSHFQVVTASVGVASTKPHAMQRPGDLIEAADAALYAAKHRGRNTVVEHGLVRNADISGSLAAPGSLTIPGSLAMAS